MPVKTVLLLIASNTFMTMAWYRHLRFKSTQLAVVILVSWLIALPEYALQVPANRYGHSQFTAPQLKIIQEVITMVIFATFCVVYMKQQLTLDYLWAGLCLVGAAYFMFRQVAAAG